MVSFLENVPRPGHSARWIKLWKRSALPPGDEMIVARYEVPGMIRKRGTVPARDDRKRAARYAIGFCLCCYVLALQIVT